MPPSDPPSPRLLITAGPTFEPIDAVRFIGNRSSGRMGLALAEAASRKGWSTTLLLGPVAGGPPEHSGVRVVRFQTTADLQGHLRREWPDHDVLLMAAAVSDFRPEAPEVTAKIPREADRLTLTLSRTPDLLAELADASRPGQIRIGFALEAPERLVASARRKLLSKHLHAVVANPLATMDAEAVAAVVLLASGETLHPPAGGGEAVGLPKAVFAEWLMEQLPAITAQRLPSSSAWPAPGPPAGRG